MTPINLKQIKISAITKPITETLSYQNTVTFAGQGDIVQIVGSNNQDGTQNITYKVKPLFVDLQISDKSGENKSIVDTIVLKEKSRSKALRERCYQVASELGESDEALYNAAMDAAGEWLSDHYFEVTQLTKE